MTSRWCVHLILAAIACLPRAGAAPYPPVEVTVAVNHEGQSVSFTLRQNNQVSHRAAAQDACGKYVEWVGNPAPSSSFVASCIASAEAEIALARRHALRTEGGWDLMARETSGAYFKVAAAAAMDTYRFATFKMDPAYRIVLEHTSAKLGQLYLDHVRMEAPSLLSTSLMDRFRLNDGIGYSGALSAGSGDYLYDFGPGVGIVSPSTLRYVSVLARLRRAFGTEWRGWRVCEIGGGYGGQAHVVMAATPMLHSYTIYDQTAPAALQNRYLAAMGWPSSVSRAKKVSCEKNENIDEAAQEGAGKSAGRVARCTIDGDSRAEPQCDIVISNYALTELSAEMQAFYAERFLRGARIGAYVEGVAQDLLVHNHIGTTRVGHGVATEKSGLHLVEEKPGVPAYVPGSDLRISRFVFRQYNSEPYT